MTQAMPHALHLTDALDDDEAFLRSMRDAMPAKSRAVMDRMDLVNSVYVTTRRDKVLGEAFEVFMEDVASTRNGKLREADIFFITGESGAGKSEAAARVLGEHPMLQPRQASFGVVRPFVSVKMAGYVTPRLAARQIIAASGHPLPAKGQRGDLWNEMPAALRKRRVRLVHIDEVQHLVGGSGTANDYALLANAIKGVSITPGWPVAFLLSGLPRITILAKDDEQFERRGRWVHLNDVDMGSQRKTVVRILEQHAKAGGLSLGTMAETDMPERIAHAANARFGRICQLVVAAIHHALRAKEAQTELLRGHFALAYASRSRARDHNAMNPFLVDDWQGLEPGAFLDVEQDEPREEEDA